MGLILGTGKCNKLVIRLSERSLIPRIIVLTLKKVMYHQQTELKKKKERMLTDSELFSPPNNTEATKKRFL